MIAKIRRLVISKLRNLSLARLCIIFCILIFLFTSYIYGLVEVSSHQVVINILPSNQIQADNDYIIGKSFIQIRKNNSNLKNSYQNDKKIKSFFIRVNENREEIERLLTEAEYKQTSEIRNAYLTLIYDRHEKLKKEMERELELLKKEEKEKVKNDGNENDDEDDQKDDETKIDPKDLKVKTTLNDDELVSRDEIISFLKLEKTNRKYKRTKNVEELLKDYKLIEQNDQYDLDKLPSIWKIYHRKINELKLNSDLNILRQVLNSMSSDEVTSCIEKERGTQIKLILTLLDGTEVLVKPMKVPRNYETPPDHFYFVDFERHHAEIAAFHVDLLLGFYRVPPTVGRVFNMTTELMQKAEPDLERTFFISPGGNLCFTGHCSYYCDSTHAICGKPKDRMEGSVQLMLPGKPVVKWETVRHPYRRTYTKKKKAEWEKDDKYCEKTVFKNTIYHSKHFLDLIDMSLFDFITSNMDRHHYERMISLGNDSFMIHLDNGRSFGKIFSDEISILAPVMQCCFIRYSTFKRLQYLYEKGFSKLLDNSLKIDPLYPILTNDHLKSVDRRLLLIFNEVMKCADKYGLENVIIDDGY